MNRIPRISTFTLFTKPCKDLRGRARAFRKSSAIGERKLLARIQIRLILWYILAFLVFEAAIVAGAYFVLQQHVMDSARQAIKDEWAQKVQEALDELKKEQDEKVPISVDKTSEVIPSWIVDKQGTILNQDLYLKGAPGPLGPLFNPLIQESHNSQSELWQVGRVGKVPVLVAAHPLYQEDTYIGTIVSAYSLYRVNSTLKTLIRIDVDLGLASILVILPLTYLLSRRSLQPIRLALQRQRSFVNDAAHELRTPLTILQGTLDLAQHETDVVELQSAIQESIGEATYISRLVGDLSTLARLESGVTAITMLNLDLSKVVQTTVEAMQALAEPHNVHLRCLGCNEEVWLNGDATRLRQLLVILLENAIKYNKPGGQVEVHLQKHRHEAEIAVSDTGIGIHPQDLPHVFDRFYRANRAEVHSSGSGIGLAIAAWVVSSHSGRIEVSSEEGKGTTFTVWLPLGPRNKTKTT